MAVTVTSNPPVSPNVISASYPALIDVDINHLWNGECYTIPVRGRNIGGRFARGDEIHRSG
jgi:uncharacterized protein YqjF (DUF2071 family)